MQLFKRFYVNSFKHQKNYIEKHFPLFSADVGCCGKAGMISVVLPVFNCEKYLDEAILSVLGQTYTNLELIIVDDGSADRSGEIADSYLQADERVRVIHQRNMTLPFALNNGFSAANGEFYTWTSADNRMLPQCLELLCSELLSDRSCDMVYGNMRLIDENGDILRGRGWYEIPPLSGNVILPDSTASLNTTANNTIGAAFLYRAGAAQTLGGYSEYKFMLEDYDYFMRMNSFFSIKHLLHMRPIYEYRMHSDSLTAHDAELGITASRPRLMELDEVRREFYIKTLNIYLDGSDPSFENALSKVGCILRSAKAMERAAAYSPMNLAYVNIGGIAPTCDIPEGVPKFLVAQNAADGSVGYDAAICRNSVSSADDRRWICIKGDHAAASYIALRAKNDLMYKYEAEISQNDKGTA